MRVKLEEPIWYEITTISDLGDDYAETEHVQLTTVPEIGDVCPWDRTKTITSVNLV